MKIEFKKGIVRVAFLLNKNMDKLTYALHEGERIVKMDNVDVSNEMNKNLLHLVNYAFVNFICKIENLPESVSHDVSVLQSSLNLYLDRSKDNFKPLAKEKDGIGWDVESPKEFANKNKYTVFEYIVSDEKEMSDFETRYKFQSVFDSLMHSETSEMDYEELIPLFKDAYTIFANSEQNFDYNMSGLDAMIDFVTEFKNHYINVVNEISK